MINDKAKEEFKKKYEDLADKAKKMKKEKFLGWISLLKGYQEDYNDIFTNLVMRDVFGKLLSKTGNQNGGADINPEIAVAVAVNLVHNSETEPESKTDIDIELSELTVLFRQYTVIVYDRLIQLTLGEHFNDLMETQVGYGDFRINNFKKVFASINFTDISTNPSILLLQEFDESYKTKNIIGRDGGIFEDEKKLNSGSSSAIYCNGTKVDFNFNNLDVVAAKLENNGNKILFVSFHADSKGEKTINILKEAYAKFSKEYQYLIIGADTNAKTSVQRQELYRYVSSNKGKLFSIAHNEFLLPTSIGMRSLLQSQFSKAIDSIEETIDYLMIFGKEDSIYQIKS